MVVVRWFFTPNILWNFYNKFALNCDPLSASILRGILYVNFEWRVAPFAI